MAAATIDVKCISASLAKNQGASANTAAGTTTLVLVFEAVESAAAIPLATAGKTVTAEDPQTAKGMEGTTLTLTYDDTTGAITSLA